MKLGESISVYSGLSLRTSASTDLRLKQKVTSPTATAELFRELFRDDEALEHLYVMGLGTDSRVLGIAHVAQGGYSNCEVDPRVLFTSLLLMGPVSGFVLCHNHPSGDPTPSSHDVALTRQLMQAGRHLCLRCVDHIVLGANGTWRSLLAEGLMTSESAP